MQYVINNVDDVGFKNYYLSFEYMGCTGSDIQARNSSVLLNNKRPSVWLIGGGPGCQKGKICDNLIRDYKFKYLSSYDIVQFQQQRGGPDAQLISKLFKQNKTMPSDLIVRLVKKAIASCGVRRFLIDGFPNSPQDVIEFDKQLTAQQIDFYGYLYIQISQKKMIQSGIQAHSSQKTKSKAEIQANVKQIVKTYINSNQKIKQMYIQKNKYHQINGQKGADNAYDQIRSYLKKINVKAPSPVKVFFSHFDNQAHQIALCDDLIRKYGLYFYTPRGLIEEAANKPNSQQGLAIRNFVKQKKEIPASLVLSLIRKKIEKHDYSGNYLISGYPRNIADAQEWDRHFGWETQIISYLTFQIPDQNFQKIFTQNNLKNRSGLKTDEINKEFVKYQQNQKQISNYYKKQQKLLVINYQNNQKALDTIHTFFGIKKFYPRTKINNKKLVFINNICGNGQVCLQSAKKRGAGIVDLEKLLQQKIKQNGLYSQLIQSFIRIGKPVSGIVASRILIQQISSVPNNLVIVNGFPNSQQQLQIWQQQVGDALQLCLIIIHSQNHKYIQQNLRDKIKNKTVTVNQKDVIELIKQNSNRVSQRLKQSDWNVYTVSSLSDSKEVEQTFDKFGFK